MNINKSIKIDIGTGIKMNLLQTIQYFQNQVDTNLTAQDINEITKTFNEDLKQRIFLEKNNNFNYESSNIGIRILK